MDYWSLWLRVSVLFIQALGFRGLGYRIQGLGSKVFLGSSASGVHWGSWQFRLQDLADPCSACTDMALTGEALEASIVDFAISMV